MSADPPHLSPGTEVSAKYKGAFCEAKIKKCQKSVKCKVSPKDGGPQISVADDAIQGHLAIGGTVKVRQPDSGQLIFGIISRIIDSSIYTVVFDDGDVATLKRTQICLKGDKHYMEGDTLDKLPLTNPEHFSSPVNLLKKERRRRSGVINHQSSAALSDDSDYEETVSTSRRISPRGNTRQALDTIGKVVSVCDKKKWVPALVIKPSNHEADMKNKGLIMVKSFRDGKIYTVTDKQLREFNREAIRGYAEDKLTKAAVEKAFKYTSTKELPPSWKRDEILGSMELPKKPPASPSPGTPTLAISTSTPSSPGADGSGDESSSSSEEEEEKSDMFIAQLYKFMDDRSTPINKPAQLYSRDVNLSRLYQKVKSYGGFNKVGATGKWKYVAKKVGFSGISAGTEMKLLYRRYLSAFEEFQRKMGDTHMFEGFRSQRSAATGGRSVLPPRDRDSHHSTLTDVKVKENRDLADKKSSPASSDKKPPPPGSAEKKVETKSSPSPAAEKKPSSVQNTCTEVKAGTVTEQPVKGETASEELIRRTPLRSASKKEDRGKATESPRRADTSASRGRPSQSKANIKVEKAAKLNLDVSKEVPESPVEPSKPTVFSSGPSPPSTPTKLAGAQVKEGSPPTASLVKPKEEPIDSKTDIDSLLSDEESADLGTVSAEVDYPPGTKVKVRYGRARTIKIYDAKVVEVKLGPDTELRYSVHYNGWNTRYDEVITSERIVGTTGKCEKKQMDLSRAGTGAGKCKKVKSSSQVVTSASSTGSRTPEPPSAAKSSANPKTFQSKAVKSGGNGGGSAAAIKNRTTRSSATEDLSLTRPTRSRSVDSTLSNMSTRRSKQRKSVLAEDTKRCDNDETSTDEESKESTVDDLDTGKQELPEQTTSDPLPSEGADKGPKRAARGGSKHTLTGAVTGSSTEAARSVEQQIDSSNDSSVLQASPQVLMSEQARSRMLDIIDSVAIGQISTIDADSDHNSDSDCPPAKRAKVERNDSNGSLPCDEAFVKIEPLGHQKTEEENSPAKESDENADLELPPLMAGGNVAPSADSEGKTSAVSSIADDSEASFGSDCESKRPSSRCALSNASALHTATSNLSLLSEQASLSQLEPGISRARQRSSTRRQCLAAKRSPRPKYLDADMREASPSIDEVSHIPPTTTRISPTKLMKSAPPRPPRQPKYNFKIEEELAEIIDQDERIAYLMKKMAEIRSLYSDVKSNLTSIERKRKRVRLGRDHSQE